MGQQQNQITKSPIPQKNASLRIVVKYQKAQHGNTHRKIQEQMPNENTKV